MSIRESFVAKFGENEARLIELAAGQHKRPTKLGSDPFRTAIVICISYECISRFGEYHMFAAPKEEVEKWIQEEAHLEEHNGDIDFLILFTGGYNKYVPMKEKENENLPG